MRLVCILGNIYKVGVFIFCMVNKPIRVSDQVKRELKRIKRKKDLRSIDAVLKKLLKQGGRPNLV